MVPSALSPWLCFALNKKPCLTQAATATGGRSPQASAVAVDPQVSNHEKSQSSRKRGASLPTVLRKDGSGSQETDPSPRGQSPLQKPRPPQLALETAPEH